MNKNLIFICWVSGSWKSTIIKQLIEFWKFEYIPSFSSRTIRPWETQWNPYFFISKQQFEKKIHDWEFLEYEINHKQDFYWTSKMLIDNAIKNWKKIIKEIDVKWLKQIIEWNILNWKYISIFLNIDDETMKKRILNRGLIDEQQLKYRIESASLERNFWKEYCNYLVDAGSSVENIVKKIDSILEKYFW